MENDALANARGIMDASADEIAFINAQARHLQPLIAEIVIYYCGKFSSLPVTLPGCNQSRAI